MANVLLIGTGTQAYAIIPGLVKNQNKVFILTQEKGNYADASRLVSKVYYTKLKNSDFRFSELVIEIAKTCGIDVIIPTGDAAAEFVSVNRDALLNVSSFKIPDYNIFKSGYDKNQLMSLCSNKGYPHPQTIDLATIDINQSKELLEFPYPAILKPNCTTGGRGMVKINRYEDLLKAYPVIHEKYGDCHLQRFIRAGGRQMKVQLYINDEGKMLAHSVLHKVRWYPVKGGSSCCAVTCENKELVNICYNILNDINWCGFADFDVIEDPDTCELLIMEINPRIPACIGAAVEAGINWGQLIVDDALGRKIEKYNYKEGIILRHLGFDILWFLKSPKRFQSNPSWFKFFGKTYYQDFHFGDQRPFWVGTYHNIKKLFNPEFKKAKSGIL